ncbi:MAG: hypothetical protein N3F03_07685 [Ignavibacteria bacterium]|nr:hypothetical protein [Ignavibacteria bacterium]
MRISGKLLYIILFIILFSRESHSQLIIQKVNDLNFGDVFIGYSATVTDLSPNAAKFMLYQDSQARMDLLVSFKLPSTLVNGSYSVNVNFANYASWARNDATTGRTYFNPYSTTVINNVRRNRYHYIWLGGTLTSSTNIMPGVYSGTIILTIEVF